MLGCSIVIPTHNRALLLKQCLNAILAQQYQGHIEIIVVDDASTDDTSIYMENLNDDRITYVRLLQNSGPSAARNRGIAHAQNDIIVFVDDDCIAQAHWLERIMATFNNPDVHAVIGAITYVRNGYVGHFPEQIVQNNNAQWPMAGNIAYRKKTLQEIGGFSEAFSYRNEDTELAIRAIANGFRVVSEPRAQVLHTQARWTAKKLFTVSKNASAWPMLKKRYPNSYRHFGGPVVANFLVSPLEYVYIAFLPIFLPLVLIRYIIRGGREFGIFFAKWPCWLLLKRYYILKEAIHQKTFIL